MSGNLRIENLQHAEDMYSGGLRFHDPHASYNEDKTYSDTKAPFVGGGDHSGQHWNVTAIETITDPGLTGQASIN